MLGYSLMLENDETTLAVDEFIAQGEQPRKRFDFVGERDYEDRATADVSQSDLTKYSDQQLLARHDFYWREAVFERDALLRHENKGEYRRTKIEINRRKLYTRAEADRVFAL